MKLKIFLPFLLLSFLSQAYCQSLKGIIIKTPVKGIGETTTLSEKASKPSTFSYVYSEKKSIQKIISIEKSSIDTTYIEKYGDKLVTTSSVIRPSALTYYKDFNSKKYKVIFTKNDKDVSIKEDLPMLTWKLHDESRIINGYNCKKATTTNTAFSTGQSIVAWYAEEIPVNDGPMHYNGLPGFIIQIEISDYTILTFDKLVFIKEKTTIEEPKNTAPDTTYAEYLKLK